MTRLSVCLFALLATGTAFAQDAAEQAWLLADTTTLRFADQTLPGPVLSAGTQVTIIARQGATLRISTGDRFGWVKADQVTTTMPAGVVATPEGVRVELGQ